MAELSPRARAKRDQISTAAQRLFLANGFAATSMDAVAAEAGVSKQTLYSYYPGKEELLTAVLLGLIQELSGAMGAGGPAPRSTAELQQALVHLAGRFVAGIMQPDYVALVRVIVAETARLPQLGDLFRRAVPERVLTGVAALLAQARQDGIVRFADADAAARLFVGPFLTYVLLDGLFATDAPPAPPGTARIEAVVSLFMNAIRTE